MNEQIRKEEAGRINKNNAKILTKLQDVRPKILTTEDWTKHCDRLDKMSAYMHSYKGSRSPSKIRSSISHSVFRSESVNNRTHMGGTPGTMDSPMRSR